MSPARVEGSFEAHPSLLDREVAELRRQGVPAATLNEPVPIRAGYIVWMSDSQFELERCAKFGMPERAFLFLVEDSGGAPFDIIAWQPQTGRLGSWLGRAWGLGEDCIYLPRFGQPLPIRRSPLGWLRAKRWGVVLLQPSLAARCLEGLGPLQAEDVEHGTELRQLLTIPPPHIVIAASALRAA